jgi:hypothetical protein
MWIGCACVLFVLQTPSAAQQDDTARVKQELDEAKGTIRDLERKLSEAKDNAKRTTEDLEKQLAEAKNRADNLERSLNGLYSELEQLKSKFDRVRVMPPEPEAREGKTTAALSAKHFDAFEAARRLEIAKIGEQVAKRQDLVNRIASATVASRRPNRPLLINGDGWAQFTNGSFWYSSTALRDRHLASEKAELARIKDNRARLTKNDPPYVPPIESFEPGSAGGLKADDLLVLQILDGKNALCRARTGDRPTVWLYAVTTAGMTEGKAVPGQPTVAVTGTRTYENVIGEKKTVCELTEFVYDPPKPGR